MKYCSYCKSKKSVSEFGKCKSRKDGLQPRCKSCRVKTNKDYYSRNRQYYLDYEKNRYRNKKSDNVARVAKRRAKKLQATPEWLTQEHLDQIKDIYAHARDCEVVTGDQYHVDHIVPLQGKDVCGLHVPWNLQVLPAEVNQSKSNKTCHLSTV
jgi:hypothetical protein